MKVYIPCNSNFSFLCVCSLGCYEESSMHACSLFLLWLLLERLSFVFSITRQTIRSFWFEIHGLCIMDLVEHGWIFLEFAQEFGRLTCLFGGVRRSRAFGWGGGGRTGVSHELRDTGGHGSHKRSKVDRGQGPRRQASEDGRA